MKTFLSYILIFAVLGHCLGKTLTFLDFLYNIEYISGTLCEKRNIPKQKCNGHCYLKKQMANQEKNEAPAGNNGSAAEVIWFHSHDAFKFFNDAGNAIQRFSQTTTVCPGEFPSVFHPPGA